MWPFRSILAVLLVLSLAATPALARAAFTMKPASAAQSESKVATPDCHGMKKPHEDPKPTHHKSCPDCDKGTACDADLCQLKCFKIVADLPYSRRDNAFDYPRLAPRDGVLAVPIDWEPRTPPPRS